MSREQLHLIELKPVSHNTAATPSITYGLRGLPGLNGKDGLDGQIGQQGAAGEAGLDGRSGTDGKAGQQGDQGKAGKDGKGIASIKFGAGLAWVHIAWSDGTEQTIQVEAPKGTVDDPKMLLNASVDAAVKDIRAGDGIIVEEDRFGNFTISVSGIRTRKTIYYDYAPIKADRLLSIDASDRTIDIDLSAQAIEGRELDIYCRDSTYTVTILGTINGSTNCTMVQYDSFRIVYNSDAAIWELR